MAPNPSVEFQSFFKEFLNTSSNLGSIMKTYDSLAKSFKEGNVLSHISILFQIYMIYTLCRVLGRSSSLCFNTSIGYRGNGLAYMTPTRTLFVRLTLFVYDPFVYPTDVYFFHKESMLWFDSIFWLKFVR